jgi:hypothetical protein
MNNPGTPGASVNAATPGTFDETLQAIERLLAEEYDALRKLNGAAIEEAAVKKTALEQRLRSFCGKVTDTPGARATLERIRRAAQRNHALLIHARACLKSTLDLATGRTPSTVTYRQGPLASAPAAAPMRVNIKG